MPRSLPTVFAVDPDFPLFRQRRRLLVGFDEREPVKEISTPVCIGSESND